MNKLKRIETFVIRYPDPNDFGFDRLTLLVRAETGDGVVGWGEAIAMWPEACKAVAVLIEEGFAPLLENVDLLEGDSAWEAMRRHSWWFGEGGLAAFAISGIDMAIWDIRGKVLGKPLFELLGGLRKNSLPACASSHVNKSTMKECVDEAVSFFDAGFPSCKLGLAKKGLSNIGGDPDRDVEFVARLRREAGDESEILVDVGNGVRWDADTAIDVANRMGEQGIGWIEEPLYPTDDAGYLKLKASTPVPIASGERNWTTTDYRRMIELGTVDVLGVDPARCEGITGFRLIDGLIGDAGRTINAHAWSTAITTAASLHLSLASSSARLFELKPFDVVVQQDLVSNPVRREGARVYPLTEPGLSVEVDERLVNKLAVE